MDNVDLEKAEEPEMQLPTSVGSQKKQGNSGETSASLTMLKPFTVWITTNWKILQEMGLPEHVTCFLRKLYAGQETTVRHGHGTRDWFKIGKEYIKTVCCHPANLTYMQSTSQEMPDCMKHKLESGFRGEISVTSDMQMTPTL